MDLQVKSSSFFSFDYKNSSSKDCVLHKQSLKGIREALTLDLHSKEIKRLQIAAIEHRRLLFQLGENHSIKLHYGACLSMTEIVVTLYLYWMNIDKGNLESAARDRFILSKGHAAPSLYIVLYQAGFLNEEDFHCYRELNSIFQGHPDRNKTLGVDCTTGSLGQGLGVSVGMAWGYRQKGIQNRTYCLISDGECNEGSIWESALIASNAKLDNLIVFLDKNSKSSFGLMKDRNDVEPLGDKWRSFAWEVIDIEGHDIQQITNALQEATSSKNGKPKIIIAHTIKGKGIPYSENNFVRSSSFLSKEHLIESRSQLDKDEIWLSK